MMKIFKVIALVILTGCSTHSSFRISELKTPKWIEVLPVDQEYVYYVGEAIDIKEKDNALQRAWNSALFRIGISEFPQLIQLSSHSNESLEKSKYERNAIEYFQLINWRGIQEVKNLGSPFIYLNPKTNTYMAYRLLRWSKRDLRSSQEESSIALDQIKKTSGGNLKTYRIPESPELLGEQEGNFISAVEKLKRLTSRIESRDNSIRLSMEELKCGVTINDLLGILGRADKVVPKAFGTSYYYWGSYVVVPDGTTSAILSISNNFGAGKNRYLCNH